MLVLSENLRNFISDYKLDELLRNYEEDYGDRILDGYIHEFIDRTHVITNIIERELAVHPAILYSAEAQELLSQTLSSLYELYQVVSSLSGDCNEQ